MKLSYVSFPWQQCIPVGSIPPTAVTIRGGNGGVYHAPPNTTFIVEAPGDSHPPSSKPPPAPNLAPDTPPGPGNTPEENDKHL